MAKNEFDITSLTPEQRDARLALDVERLLRFGRKHKLIKDLDILVARNTLLDLLALAAPSEAKPPKEDPETPAALLDEMVELAAQKELFDGAVNQYRINFETRLMARARSARSSASSTSSRAPRPLPTGSISSASTRTTSAPRRSPRTSSGTPPPPTASWRSPST
jgi:hypothetical protein